MSVADFYSRLHTGKGNLKLWTNKVSINVANQYRNNFFVSGSDPDK